MYFLGKSFFDMSESSAKLRNEANKNQKRNLPSWMSSSDNGSKSHGKKSTDADNDEENEKTEETKQAKGHDKALGGGSHSNKAEHSKKSAASSSSATNFSKLLVLNFIGSVNLVYCRVLFLTVQLML